MTEFPQDDPRFGGPVPPGPGRPDDGAAERAGQDPVVEPFGGDVTGDDTGGDVTGSPAGDEVEPEIVEGEVIEGEVVEPSDATAAEADALLAEAFDADEIEARFSEAEADAAKAAGVTGAAADEVVALTADLQRVHAEYSNYRKRVERDRELVRERAVESALVEFLPILDDIGRARAHDELVGGFKGVGEALEAAVTRLGLVAFGVPGEPFDPTRHEALMREEREGVTEPTIVTVLQVGYEMNGRIVRPARVSVAGVG